ncbi:MAG: 3-dehydroquinate synthase [Firmicutes bacterium]|nr:3-dehydroquinate synthase [Bacillota bacterium]
MVEVVNIDIKNREYKIFIGKNNLKEIHNILKENDINKIFIITDENVSKLYLNKLLKYLTDYEVHYHTIKPGENSKSLDTASLIYEKMLSKKCNRKTLLLSFGGGVVGDLAGFIASTYMRGIDFFQIPTTLLSQVDSSVGGKVGINHLGYKNILGSFYQPKGVLIDINLLNTLNKKEITSGIGELIKYGLILDYGYYKKIYNNINEIYSCNSDLLKNIIKEAIIFKKRIIELDEFDRNIRAILNFGHTIGHSIESLYNFDEYNHGEAVLLGILYEAYIALLKGVIDNNYYNEIYNITKVISPIKFSEKEISKLLNIMENDKKNSEGSIVFILPTGKGNVKIYNDINKSLIVRSLKEVKDYKNFRK